MKVILYYPPLVISSAITPYPSLPILSSYLKSNRNYEVVTKDINVDLINKLIDLGHSKGIKYKASFFRRLKDEVKKNILREKIRMPIEKAEFLTLEGLRLMSDNFAIGFNDYNDLKVNVAVKKAPNILYDFWNLTYDQLKEIINNNKRDSLLYFLGKDYFSEVPTKEKILVGISVAFVTQFGMAISLSNYIKRVNPDAFIVMGGATIRHVSRNFEKIPEIFNVIDCFVEQEGEGILVELADSISGGKNWKKVNGIIYRNDVNKVIKNPGVPFDINQNDVPDYSLIGNHKYLEPRALYLRASVGCYYNRCAFCALPFKKYQERSIDNIIRDIIFLKRKYNIKKLYFSDESISYDRLSKIADKLIDSKAKIKWYAFSRFDKNGFTKTLCKKLKKSGCFRLSLGLESWSQRVNDLMNKGVRIEDIKEAIKNLKNYGVGCVINSIIGFPEETEEEALQTINFLKSNWPRFSAALSIFSLNYGSDVYFNPEKYGITSIQAANDFFYKENNVFTIKNQIPYVKLLKLQKLYYVPHWKEILREIMLLYRRLLPV